MDMLYLLWSPGQREYSVSYSVRLCIVRVLTGPEAPESGIVNCCQYLPVLPFPADSTTEAVVPLIYPSV